MDIWNVPSARNLRGPNGWEPWEYLLASSGNTTIDKTANTVENMAS